MSPLFKTALPSPGRNILWHVRLTMGVQSHKHFVQCHLI